MAEKKEKFSFKKLFFMKSFFSSLVGKTKLNDKPLNWLSIMFLIAFDIFIFINIIDGLDNVSKNITSPHVKYDYTCSDFFNYKSNQNYDYNKLSIINGNTGIGVTKNINAPFYDSEFNDDNRSEYCKEINTYITNIKNNSNFKSTYSTLESVENRKSSLETQKRKYEKEYNEFRDDTSSGLKDYDSRLSEINSSSVRSDYNIILSQLEQNKKSINNLENIINSNSTIIELKKYIKENKKDFIYEKENYNFWYPVYVTGMEIILILPILLLSLLLYKFSIKANRKILLILSSNLALISGFFAFWILIKIIYWVIPHKFLANILTYLASIKALAIWNYLLTIFGIIMFGALMFFSQKAVDKYKKVKEDRKKELEKLNIVRVSKERYWEKACIECNTKLLEGATHCSNCGANQYKQCSKCKNNIPRAYSYCEKCGTKN